MVDVKILPSVTTLPFSFKCRVFQAMAAALDVLKCKELLDLDKRRFGDHLP